MAVRTVTTDDGSRDDGIAPRGGGNRSRSVGDLALGLRDQWFPILRSSALANKPLRVRRFGEDLALWRDGNGEPHIFQDRCPHRGASLSLGQIRGDKLSCSYHGWTYDQAGRCVEIPLGDSLGENLVNLKRRACLKTFPAEDRAGYIWAFYGDASRKTPLSIVPYELEDARWSVIRQEYEWETNWINILDNIFDPLHALFLHVGVATQLRRAQLMNFEVTEDFEEGFHLAKRGVLPNGHMGEEGVVQFLLPALFRLDLADATPRGLMRVVMFPTPIDENRTYLCYIQARRVSGLARLWWHVLWHARLRRAQDLIKKQDHIVLQTLGDIEVSRAHENLTYSDVGVVHLRRRLEQAYARSQDPQGAKRPTEPERRVRGPKPFAAWESSLDSA